MNIHYEDNLTTIIHGDCIEAMRELADDSIDAIVTDPPYGLEFMGKEWDAPWKSSDSAVHAQARTKRAAEVTPTGQAHSTSAGPYLAAGVNKFAAGLPFQQWCQLWTAEALRVLKPGGYALSFGGTRTFHRLACAIEDAGFEIRDTIFWAYGSGFPKSRNVTQDIESMPRCTCDVSDQAGIVDAGVPAGAVGAGVGAVPGAVSLAGLAADEAVRVGPQVVTASASGVPDVDALDVNAGRHSLPVVLGSLGVTPGAEGQQVVGRVGNVEIDPEPLRDQVVREQVGLAATVSTGAIPGNNIGGDIAPSTPLVLPLTATPGGVTLPRESGSVAGGHAFPRTVEAAVSPAAELNTADGAGEDSVSFRSHAPHSTPERAVRCEECGGVRGPIRQGMGTALKPGAEPVVVGRKPFRGTVAQNVLAHGTGALNIDGCRIGYESEEDKASARPQGAATSRSGNLAGKAQSCANSGSTELTTAAPTKATSTSTPTTASDAFTASGSVTTRTTFQPTSAAGRWPANVILDSSQAAALDQMSGTLSYNPPATYRRDKADADRDGSSYVVGRDGGDLRQGYSDKGGASRFFYCAKAPKKERPVTDDGTAHPTVKPLALMRWLVRLVTPPGGVVLDPFAGSGTTVEAALLEGFRVVGIEREADYLPLIEARIRRTIVNPGEPTEPVQDCIDFGESA